MNQRSIIIGSGFGGATAGALLQKKGHEVTLLESAAEWGGSAGKFQRKKFRFPVGATLAMGLEKNGIHEQINTFLNIKPEARRLSKVMDVHIGSRTIPYFQNRKQFIRMWYQEVPESAPQIEAFLKEVWHYASIIRKHMEHYPVVMPNRMHEAAAVLRGLSISSVTLLPHINATLDKLVKKHDLENVDVFTHFINGVLIDSMQTEYNSCSLLLGSTALDIYHRGVWYMEGGLYKMIEELIGSIQSNGGTAKRVRRAVKVYRSSENEKLWNVEDHRGNIYQADHVVFNVPVKNIKNLLQEKDYQQIKPNLKDRETSSEQWGAFTMYLSFEDILPENTPLFQQVLRDPALPPDAENHFFISLSRKGDLLRAPAGYRTLTISTHIRPQEWATKEKYDKYAENIQQAVLEVLNRLYPGFTEAVHHALSGGPRAWERYTLRSGGEVGGFPQTPEQSMWHAVKHRTRLKGVWLCGDNIFPGAGSIGAASSGVHVARSILKERIL